MAKDYLNVFNINGERFRLDDRPVDEFDRPVERTKAEYPYSYDGFVVWRGGSNGQVTNTIYTDRLLGWDYDKHNRLCQRHFGDERQYWNRREPEKIEAFLRDWTGNPRLRLILIMEYCNWMSGYPAWRLDYAD